MTFLSRYGHKDGVDNNERIIQAASKIIMEKGVDNTSLSDIAKAVGISKGTLYYYYPSKNDLIYEITERHLNMITQEMMVLVDSVKDEEDKKKVLYLLFERIINAKMRGKLHLYLLKDALSNNDALKNKIKRKYKEWVGMIEEGLAKIYGDKDIDYLVISNMILAMLDGFSIQSVLDIDNIPIEDIVDSIIKE